jgi:hypothetical protein
VRGIAGCKGSEEPNHRNRGRPYAGRFDCFHAVQASVSKTCLVRFDNKKYSVAACAVGRPVEVHAYADRVVIRQDGRRHGAMKPAGTARENNNLGQTDGFFGHCGQCGVRGKALQAAPVRLAASAELEELGRGQVWELPDGRLYQHGGNRPFLLAVSSRVRIPRSSEASPDRRPPAWGPRQPVKDPGFWRAFEDGEVKVIGALPPLGRHGGDDRLLVENSAGTVSMGDPYATPRRQNVVTPWSKKHPDGGSATAQRTDSVTCNAIPSAQVVHSTPTKRPECTTHPRSRYL